MTTQAGATGDTFHQGMGVIREDIGKMSFIEDVITVKLNVREMSRLRDSLVDTKTQITDLLKHPKKSIIFNGTEDLLERELEKLEHLLPSRQKRSLFHWGGDLLHSVFGTATDEQVNEVKGKIKNIEKWAHLKGKMVEAAVKRINAQSERIVQLNTVLTRIAKIVNVQAELMDEVKINTWIVSVAADISFILEQFSIFQNAFVLASKNIISPELFPPSDLAEILQKAKDEFGFKLLYNNKDILKYYTLLRGKVIGIFVYIFVPFASANEQRVFHLIPFPTFLNNSVVVELDSREVVIILTSNFDLLAVTDKDQFTEDCFAIASGNYICPASKLHFFPSVNYSCLLQIAVHMDIDSSCKFRFDNQTSLAVKHIAQYNYLFSRQSVKLTLNCGQKSPEMKTVVGNFRIHEDCGVSSPNLIKIYPSHSHAVSTNLHMLPSRSLLLRNYFPSTEHKQIVIKQITTPAPLVDNTDVFLDFSTSSHQWATYVGTPVLMIVVVIILCTIARVVYIKKIRGVLTNFQDIRHRITTAAEMNEEVELGDRS